MSADSNTASNTTSSTAAKSKSAPTVKPPAPMVHDPLHCGVKSSDPATYKADVVVVGAFADGTLSAGAQAIDTAAKGRLSTLVKDGDLEATPGASLMLYDVPGIAASRVLLMNFGSRDEFDDETFFKTVSSAAKVLAAGSNGHNVAVALTDVEMPGNGLASRLQHTSRILADGAYRFDAPHARTNGKTTPKNKHEPRNIMLLLNGTVTPELENAVRRGQAIAEGMALTKDLGNLPANICTPKYLADTARLLGDEFRFDVDVLERDDMEKLGMFSALSVGRASDQPCKFVVMHYKGGPDDAKPVVLVGKGVTFDTGGVSLKPDDGMDMMKYDMSGAASVIGALKTVARLRLPINVVGIIGAVENMPGGNATRPGDVVTSMSGITIEILNTDAEGRLVLCDALTYAERFDPACVIDIATLTGACVVALGTQTTGLFANDDKLAAELLECGTDTGDRAWQLPIWDEYQDQLKSNFADINNIGGRTAGSITAACFLSRFAKGYKWAHLDIAGTASVGGDAKGATGRPVPLLSEFLIRQADHIDHM